MKMAQRYLIVLSILFAAGCSSIKVHYQDDLAYVDELIKNEEYGVALRFIDQQKKESPSYPQLQQQRPLLVKKIEHYEQLIVTQSKELVKAQKWGEAIELLEKATEYVPDSKLISRELSKQKSIRDEEIFRLQYQITVHEARELKEDKVLYHRLYRLDPTTSKTPEIVQKRAETIAQELLQWTKHYVNEKETIKARNSLKLAGEVVPEIRRSAEFRTLLRNIEEIEKEITKAIKRKREIELEKQVREFNRLFEQEHIIEAQMALKEIERRFGKTETTSKLRQKLDRIVSSIIEMHMTKGKGFYSKEQLELAINQWGHVLLLDPDNQKALEHISRAVKVLEQLQKVRKNQRQ